VGQVVNVVNLRRVVDPPFHLASARHDDERDLVPFDDAFRNLLFAVAVGHGAGEFLPIHFEDKVDRQIVAILRFEIAVPFTAEVGGKAIEATERNRMAAANYSSR
jgi:hypothetical protein